ncbi:MAG: ferrochelatase [Rhodospirillaceae bacterium]|nr:ferrochelatase [Rhodospirillaceae bacterium]
MARVAVILCNLGGPDSSEAIEPFLRNLFADPVILQLPQPFRWMLGRFIVWRRLPIARHNYGLIGGSSPLLKQTQDQANALQHNLCEKQKNTDFRCFVSMRYWHPLAIDVVKDVKDWNPDRVIMLPLYPQYSITTTGSSFLNWRDAAEKSGLFCPHIALCCYPILDGWIRAITESIREILSKCSNPDHVRVVFSAHGLPKSIVDAGDPYPSHVEASVDAVVEALRMPALDWVLSYQSRVGPQAWIGPFTEDIISKAGEEGRSLLVVPIAFVSEHSETLVELDIDYRNQAIKAGVPEYWRAPTVQCHTHFIDALADLVDFAAELPCDSGNWFFTGDGCRKACQAASGHCIMD